MTDAPDPAAAAFEEWEGWLIEETWVAASAGTTHYIHRDFSAERWLAENDRPLRRRQAKFITKDANEALRFDTLEDAEAWFATQPHWLRNGDQYRAREHMALVPPSPPWSEQQLAYAIQNAFFKQLEERGLASNRSDYSDEVWIAVARAAVDALGART